MSQQSEKLWQIRKSERRQFSSDRLEGQTTDRDFEQYKVYFHGLDFLLRTVADSKELPHVILEVGIGKGIGYLEMAQKHLPGLQFKGVGLSRPPNLNAIEATLGTDSFHLTTVEHLRGIEDHSIGAIIGLHSISYSAVEKSVHSMDRVLAPGGVIKAVMAPGGNVFGENNSDTFIREWMSLGYQTFSLVTTEEVRFFSGNHSFPHLIVVAVKPNQGKVPLSAEEMFIHDETQFLEELQSGSFTSIETYFTPKRRK